MPTQILDHKLSTLTTTTCFFVKYFDLYRKKKGDKFSTCRFLAVLLGRHTVHIDLEFGFCADRRIFYINEKYPNDTISFYKMLPFKNSKSCM